MKDEDVEGRIAHFSLKPAGEDESGTRLFRLEGEGEGDVEGKEPKIARDVEGHMVHLISLEPTGEEEGGDPVVRVRY